MTKPDYDLIIVGGGLSGGLLARYLGAFRSDVRWLLLVGDATLGGNHTWSFHESDLSLQSLSWIRPLITKEWFGYDVHFLKHRRSFQSRYYSIASSDFHRFLVHSYGDRIRTETRVQKIFSNKVELFSGESLTAGCVIDARGLSDSQVLVRSGYQKFIGWDVELEDPHGLSRPLLMDVTIPQKDGFRFFYLLPWSDTRLLIEDTYYSRTDSLDKEEIRKEIRNSLCARGWKLKKVEREEVGCLPIPCEPSTAAISLEDADIPKIGMALGLAHPTTGYSLPYACRTAEVLGGLILLQPRSVKLALMKLVEEEKSAFAYFLFLNRMMFWAATDSERYRIFERFYRLSENLIQNFYRGRLTPWNQARILMGKPPVSVKRAVKSLWQNRDLNERVPL